MSEGYSLTMQSSTQSSTWSRNWDGLGGRGRRGQVCYIRTSEILTLYTNGVSINTFTMITLQVLVIYTHVVPYNRKCSWEKNFTNKPKNQQKFILAVQDALHVYACTCINFTSCFDSRTMEIPLCKNLLLYGIRYVQRSGRPLTFGAARTQSD